MKQERLGGKRKRTRRRKKTGYKAVKEEKEEEVEEEVKEEDGGFIFASVFPTRKSLRCLRLLCISPRAPL